MINHRGDARYHEPTFGESALTVSFSSLTAKGGLVTFPAADAANVIMYYSVQVKDKTTGDPVALYDKLGKDHKTNLKTPANHIYYPSGEHMPKELSLALTFEGEADLTHEYVLYLQGVDDFGRTTVKYAFALDLTAGECQSTGIDASKEPERIKVSFVKGDKGSGAYPRKEVKTSGTDLAGMTFTVSGINMTGNPKGFGLMLTAVGYAYDRYGFMVAYVDDTVLVYRSGSASGSHASTGASSFAVSHFIGAVAWYQGTCRQ